MDLNKPEIKREIYQFRVEQLKKLRSFLKSKEKGGLLRIGTCDSRFENRLETSDRIDREK